MKNILIISNNALSKSKNNGKTLESLFSNYKEGDIFQLYFNNEEIDSSIVKDSLRFSAMGITKKSHGKTGGLININTSKLKTIINDNIEAIKLYIRDLLYLNTPKSIFHWVEEKKPSCIFILIGNYTFPIKIALKISKLFKIPILTYVTDDYVIEKNLSGLFKAQYQSKLVKAYNEILKNSKHVYFISEYMREDFESKFNIKGSILINCTTVNNISKRSENKETPLIITYAGGLHLGRMNSIIEFAQSLKEIEKLTSIELKLVVYTATPLSFHERKEFSNKEIQLNPPLSWENLEKEIIKSDFLLHVESFDVKTAKKTKYSLSTKIPEYLSSNNCVIAYGPQNIASMKIFNENNIGIFFKPNDEKSKKLLIKAITDKVFREKIASQALQYFEDNFSVNVIQTRLYKAIREL